MSCGIIYLDSSAECTSVNPSGTVPIATLINYDDINWSGVTYSGGKVTALPLETGKQAFQFFGTKQDVKYSVETIDPGNGYTQFKHNTGLTIYERTQAQKLNMEALARGLFVAIIEQKGADADAFVALGLGAGLQANIGVINNAHENGAAWIFTFSTPANEFEKKLPPTLGVNYAAGAALLADLISSS